VARQDSSKTSDVPKKWRELLGLLPGYDPFAQAKDCWFEPEKAQKVIDFFAECLKHVEGDMAGKPFVLERWQQAIVANLFGWQRLDSAGRQVRRYREAFIMVPRKNGKTPLVAGIALFVLFCDPEIGQQDYIAAAEREQAGMLFRQAKGMVEQEPEMNARVRIYGGKAEAGQSRSIVREETNSFMRVVSADARTKHGGTSHLVVVDETHVQPNRDLIDVLTTSFASENRKQPLFINLTTAGHDRQSICYEKYQEARRVRDNGGDELRPGHDPTFLPVIYETLPDADWTSEETWRQANPNLGVSVSLDYLRRECKKAQEIPDYENTFRQLHLDQWTEQATRWLSMTKWDACGKVPVCEQELEGRSCFGAFDLASTQDLTAAVLVFSDADGSITLLPRFWVPEDMVRRRDLAKESYYRAWERAGLITVTPGDWCDYTIVKRDILDWNRRFFVRKWVFDPREASMLAQQLLDEGATVEPFTQSFANYNEAVKHFEQLVGEVKVRHGNHPVLNWNAQNVMLAHNAAGLRMPSKGSSAAGKIDGIVAALMAHGAEMTDPGGSVYGERGVLLI
jgi:phage terminase large subunit-like protein